MTLSIIIPAFNRIVPLRASLESITRARRVFQEPCEIVLVDDGSDPPLETVVKNHLGTGDRIVRQDNKGSIVARLHGLSAARGELVLFLDSDDLVLEQKLVRHTAAIRKAEANLSVEGIPVGQRILDAPQLFLERQPLPDAIVYQRKYLTDALERPLLPANRRYDRAGDVWLYYNLLLTHPVITTMSEVLGQRGVHQEGRFSDQWELLGLCALNLAEDFLSICPATAETQHARRCVAESAFRSWRRLPSGIPSAYLERVEMIWNHTSTIRTEKLGGRIFQATARLLGLAKAGRLFRAIQSKPYEASRTLPAGSFEAAVQSGRRLEAGGRSGPNSH